MAHWSSEKMRMLAHYAREDEWSRRMISYEYKSLFKCEMTLALRSISDDIINYAN